MIKFYLKIENNMLVNKFLYIISSIILTFNIILRIFPELFMKSYTFNGIEIIIPIELFEYCDGYLLMLFVILIFFFLGTDFTNSMEDISLVIGGSKTNKFMIRKLVALLSLYLVLYIITFINIYTLYSKCQINAILIPLNQIIFFSFTSNLFIISLSLFLLFLFRDIIVSTTIMSAFYLIEELLWRCRIFKSKGVLGHIYRYFDCDINELYKIKFIYIGVSLILLFSTYLLSKRKVKFKLLRFIKK